MDKSRLATITAVVALIGTAIGWDWATFLKGMALLPDTVRAFTAGLPFGFLSFMLSLGIGCGIWAAIYTHPSICKTKPHSCADMTAVGAGMAVNLIQQVVTATTPRELVMAMLLGLFAGLLAMFLSRLAWSFFAKPKVAP